MAPSPRRNPNHGSKRKDEEPWLTASFRPANFLPDIDIGFLLGLLVDLSSSWRSGSSIALAPSVPASQGSNRPAGSSAPVGGTGPGGEELKMVLVVRQDLQMGAGKIASQCARKFISWTLVFFLGCTNLVLREFEKCGVILRHHSGPREGNWIHILCKNSYDSRKALQKNGIQLSSGVIIGVKHIDPMHRHQLDERLTGINQGGFMVSLPSKSLVLKSTGASNQLGALPRPYDPKANIKAMRDAGRRTTGSVAAPTKSMATNVMDFIFGI